MPKKILGLIASTVFAVGLATGGSAATVTYTNAETTPSMTLTIDDAASPGNFRFSLSTTVGNADYLGLAFNFAGTSIAQGDISLVSATKADDTAITPALLLFGNNTGSQNDCGGGCNFNGSGSATVFDYIVGIGEQGGGGPGGINFVKSVVFDVMASGSLADNPFSGFAVRAQTTSNPSGSIKTNLTPEISAVPLPAGLPLLVSGLLAIGFLRRRRNA